MPIGWYPAQGLIPSGPDSSDDEEGPCELPDGRLVCGPHGFVVCGKCCVDYSFMDEDDDDEEDEDEDDKNVNVTPSPEVTAFLNRFGLGPSSPGTGLKRGTGQLFPTKFAPPSTAVTPDELFTGRRIYKFTLPNDPGTGLIRTDGACLNNGRPNPTAGWGFFHGLGPSGTQLTASARLEKKGPWGDDALQTSNRAELRAVIAALRLRHWPGEGFHKLVIATDSEYVVEGSTAWARTWIRNNWRTRAGPVKNKDLWEALLGEVERYNDYGMTVQFWRIPREWNTVADAAAKDTAAEADASEQWAEMIGLNC